MALRVWLPLNGTLENKGASNLTFTNLATANTTVNTGGKIGSCYNNNSFSAGGLRSDTTIDLGTQQSMFCWVNFTSLNSNSNLGGGLISQHRHTANTGMGLTIKYVSSTTGYLSVDTGNGSSRTFNTYCATTLMNAGTWYHVGYTYDGANIKLYVNGVCEKTQAFTGMSVPANYITVYCWSMSASTGNEVYGGYKLNGKLNDVRVYDHCLSAAEVHEISQGLVLHYKLDSFQGGLGNPNLYTGSRDFSGSWGNGSNWTTATETYKGFTVKQRSATWAGLHQNITCAQNDIFTISFYAKVESGGTIKTIHRSNLGNVTTGLSIIGGNIKSGEDWIRTSDDGTQWGYYWATVKIVSADITYLQWRLENSVNGKNMCICGIKLEKGSSATGWSPAASESSFNIIQDSSGYGHNGTILNTITLSSDTPRYSASTNLTAGNSMINCGRGAMVTDSLTVNLWIKYSTWGNPISCTEGGGWNFENSSGIQFPVYIASVGYKVANAGTLPSANTWHMITGTYNRLEQTINIYIDGELKKSTATGSSNLIGYHGSNVIWIGAEATGSNTTASNGMIGLVSDVRIYCTALSADDILSLYHTAAKVDNLGGLHTFEAIENLSNIIFKIDSARGAKVFQDGLSRYTQSQCQVTLTDEGYHIYRPPNLVYSSAGKVMWGGLKLVNQTSDTISPYNASRDNVWGLQKTHTYLFAFHAKGQSSNSPSLNVQNNMGWDRIAGMGPNPTYISTSTIPANFNGEKDCYIIFTINDDIIKTATKTEGGYTTGEQYLSYRDLSLNYGYTDTGALGTDLYLTDFRLYDVTNYIGQIKKTGITNFSDYVERNGILQIRNKAELLTSNLIER